MAMRALPAIACVLLILTPASNLRSQDSQEVILAARRTGVAELIDPATLNTVARLYFGFPVERLAASPKGSEIYVEGYRQGGCCEHYVLDLSTLKLNKSSDVTSGRSLLSPDAHWRAETTSFRGPMLRMVDLSTGTADEMTPFDLPLTEEDCGGNWYAQGTWFGDRFYFYVACPRHAGFLWSVVPGAKQLGSRIAVASFGRADCADNLPVSKVVIAARNSLLLYEPFGGKSDRTGMCQVPLAGGAWIIDPATGQLARHIGAEFHFNVILPEPKQSVIYGVDPGDATWSGPVRLIAFDIQNDQVLNWRTFDPGVLEIAVGNLSKLPAGDIQIAGADQ